MVEYIQTFIRKITSPIECIQIFIQSVKLCQCPHSGFVIQNSLTGVASDSDIMKVKLSYHNITQVKHTLYSDKDIVLVVRIIHSTSFCANAHNCSFYCTANHYYKTP